MIDLIFNVPLNNHHYYEVIKKIVLALFSNVVEVKNALGLREICISPSFVRQKR